MVDKVKFLWLPRNEKQRQIWLEAIGKENLNMNKKKIIICSNHFEESLFNKTLGLVRLRDGAVPTLFKHDHSATHSTSKSKDTPSININEPADLDHSTQPICLPSTSKDILSISNQPAGSCFSEDATAMDVEMPIRSKLKSKLDEAYLKIDKMHQSVRSQKRKIKCLNETVRRKNIKLAKYEDIIKDLKQKNLNCYQVKCTMETGNIFSKELCFACLAKNPKESLTNDMYETYINITLLKLPEDVPKKLCNSCDRLLKEVNDFKSICTESYNWLMKMRQEQLSASQAAAATNQNQKLIESQSSNTMSISNPIIVKNKSRQPKPLRRLPQTKSQLVFYKAKNFILNPTEDDIVLIVSDSMEKGSKSADTRKNKLLSHNKESSNLLHNLETEKSKELKVSESHVIAIDDEDNDDHNLKTDKSNVELKKSESHVLESINDDDDDDNLKSEKSNVELKKSESHVLEIFGEFDGNDDEINILNSDIREYVVNSDDNTRKENLLAKSKDSNAIIEPEIFTIDFVDEDIEIENNESPENVDLYENDNDINEIYQKETEINTEKLKIDKKLKEIETSKWNQNMKKIIGENDEFVQKNYTVRILSAEEQIEEFNKRKYSDNYQNGKFKCELCLRGFMIEESYKNHMYSHTDKCGNMICGICNLHYKSTSALCKHRRNVHKQILSCRLCPFTATSDARAKLHTAWHDGVKYKCEICGKQLGRMSAFYSHRRIHHATDHVCVLCGYTFLGKKGLGKHMRLKHLDKEIPVDGPKCDECNLTFANEKVLATHKATSKIHGGKKKNHLLYNTRKQLKEKGTKTRNIKEGGPKTCEQLAILATEKRYFARMVREAIEIKKHPNFNREDGWKLSHSWDPIVHQLKGNIHKTDQPGDTCNAVLPTDQKYRRHFYKYHSGSTITQCSYLCFICGKTYHTDQSLRTHLFSHDLGKTYKCDLCDLTFTTLKHYSYHYQQKHKKRNKKKIDRKYDCKICGKGFSSDSNRSRHESTFHSDVRNERCNFCEKTFKSYAEKQSHTDHVHFKKPWSKKKKVNKKNTESIGDNSS